MPALWVLAVLAVLLILLLCTRLRLVVSAKNGRLSIEARAGFVRYRLYPPPERKPRPEKPPKEKKKAKPAAKRDPLRDAERLIKTIRRVWEPVMEALRSIRGAVRIDPLRVHVTFGGRDEPADAAIACGDSLALVWTVMPVLEQLCRVPDPLIRVDVDFDTPVLSADVDVGLTLRVWALLVSLGPLLGLLRKENRT